MVPGPFISRQIDGNTIETVSDFISLGSKITADGDCSPEIKTCLLFRRKTMIMASGSITSWQIEGEKVEAVTGFIFLGSKITVNGDCSHEI